MQARAAEPLSIAPDADELTRLRARVSELEEQVRTLKRQLEQARAVNPRFLVPDLAQPYSQRVTPQPRVHPDSRQFEFNGRTYYIMPLELRAGEKFTIPNVVPHPAELYWMQRFPSGDLIDDRPRQK
jgi:hypothetical protein